MGTYNSAVITNAGQAMIAQSFVGSDLRFTTVKTSAYVYPTGTNLSELVTINSIKQSKGITGAAVYNSRVIKVSAMVDNAGITTAYDINTIGVYASVGTDAEQLFAVITAIDADTMPAFNNRPYSYIYELNLTVGSTENLTVTVNNAGFVNVNDLNVAVEGKLSTDGNASQVTVDFTSGDLADSDVTKDTGYTSVATVGSGETATSLLTKISNVIKNVRWIYKFLGTSDISSVGNGTVTNAVTTLKSNVVSLNDAITNVSTGTITTSISYLTVEHGYIRKIGKVVSISCIISTSAQMNAWTQAGLIPNGFRPAHPVNTVGVIGSTSDAVRVQIGASGIINFGSAMAANTSIHFAACYVCA